MTISSMLVPFILQYISLQFVYIWNVAVMIFESGQLIVLNNNSNAHELVVGFFFTAKML